MGHPPPPVPKSQWQQHQHALDQSTANSDEATRALSGSKLHRAVADGLRAAVAAPARSPDDWSLLPHLSCSCDDCAALTRFLADPKAKALEWPLAKERRRHIHGVIDAAGLPVGHTTHRQGRPYTLQLRKLAGIKKKEAQYRRWQCDLLRRVEKRLAAEHTPAMEASTS